MLAALLCFVQNGLCDCVAVTLVLLREFSVTSIRLIAAAKGEVVAANIWGKVKTVTQMTAVIVILAVQSALGFLSLADIPLPEFANTIIFWSGEALIWISTVFAVISGVIYLKQNWKFIENI